MDAKRLNWLYLFYAPQGFSASVHAHAVKPPTSDEM
jgi:hypothetical protein